MQNYKILEQNRGENLHVLRFGKEGLDKTAKAWSMKKNFNKLNLFKIKNIYSMNDNVKR